MPKVIVKLENLNKHFGDVIAVDNVNLEIEEGEFVTLLGPSGCGKTTTLRMIAGHEAITQGAVGVNTVLPVSPASSVSVPVPGGPAGQVSTSARFVSSFPPRHGPPCPLVASSARTT